MAHTLNGNPCGREEANWPHGNFDTVVSMLLGQPWGDERVMQWIRANQAPFWEPFSTVLPLDECLTDQNYFTNIFQMT